MYVDTKLTEPFSNFIKYNIFYSKYIYKIYDNNKYLDDDCQAKRSIQAEYIRYTELKGTVKKKTNDIYFMQNKMHAV